MSEKITIRKRDDLDAPLPADRDLTYKEQVEMIKRGEKPDVVIEAVALLLFTPDGELIVQKRSHLKNHNPYMIDKAVGGHMKYGDSALYTLMVETVQELRVPSIVLRDEPDFKKTYMLLNSYLDHVAIIQELDKDEFIFERNIDTQTYRIPYYIHLYLGVYSGATKPVDKEASGILFYDLEIMKQEMKHMPHMFTHDLRFYLDRYAYEIDQFVEYIKANRLLLPNAEQ